MKKLILFTVYNKIETKRFIAGDLGKAKA